MKNQEMNWLLLQGNVGEREVFYCVKLLSANGTLDRESSPADDLAPVISSGHLRYTSFWLLVCCGLCANLTVSLQVDLCFSTWRVAVLRWPCYYVARSLAWGDVSYDDALCRRGYQTGSEVLLHFSSLWHVKGHTQIGALHCCAM